MYLNDIHFETKTSQETNLFCRKTLVFKEAVARTSILGKFRHHIVQGNGRANPSLVHDLLKIYAKFLVSSARGRKLKLESVKVVTKTKTCFLLYKTR